MDSASLSPLLNEENEEERDTDPANNPKDAAASATLIIAL